MHSPHYFQLFRFVCAYVCVFVYTIRMWSIHIKIMRIPHLTVVVYLISACRTCVANRGQWDVAGQKKYSFGGHRTDITQRPECSIKAPGRLRSDRSANKNKTKKEPLWFVYDVRTIIWKLIHWHKDCRNDGHREKASARDGIRRVSNRGLWCYMCKSIKILFV